MDKKNVEDIVINSDVSLDKNDDSNDKEASLDDIVHNDYQEKTIVDMKAPTLKIGVASDHRGYKLKQKVTKYLKKKGYTVVDYGCDSSGKADYTEYGFKLGKAVRDGDVLRGIAICGSGIGISMACNKVRGVRCGKVSNVHDAKVTREDNDANVIAFGSKMPLYRVKDVIDVFLRTKFKDGHHQDRVDNLNSYEE